MPIPKPGAKEDRSSFISRCVSFISKEKKDRPHKQIIAMCYTSWRDTRQLSKEDVCALAADLIVASVDE